MEKLPARPPEDRPRDRTEGAKAACEGCGHLEGGEVARDRDWHGPSHLKRAWLKASTAILVCRRAFMCPPPGRGTFWCQIFIQASSPEICRKKIFGCEGGCWRGMWVGLSWATSLEKSFGGATAIVSFRPGGWMQQSAVPRCAILSVGSTGGIGQ